MAAPIEECSLQKYFGGSCGPANIFPSEIGNLNLKDCNKTITGHLRSCKLGGNDVKNEAELLCKRAGIWRWSANTDRGANICPSHRYLYGIGWKPGLKCGFPGHPQSSKKGKPQRGMTVRMCEMAQLRWGYLCRLGTGICRQCLDEVSETSVSNHGNNNSNNIQDSVHDESANTDKSEQSDIRQLSNTEEYTDFSQDSQITQLTGLSQDSQVSNWSDDVGIHTLDKFNSALVSVSKGSFSPLKYQLETSIDKIKESTIRYIKRKANQSVDYIMEAIAPGQGVAVKKMLVKEMNTPSDHYVQPNLVQEIIQLYNATTDNRVKRQLLALISKQLSKQEMLRAIPDLTTYRIDQARLDLTSAFSSGMQIIEKSKHNRKRMNDEQLQHALSFFFDPSFIQIVSYGTRDLKMESGNTVTIPNVVRTACHTKIIQMYQSYCKEVEFKPLGLSSLFKILEACAASKRTNLQGLDNIACEGSEGYDNLITIVEDLHRMNVINIEESKELTISINSSKLYIKTDYKIHVQEENHCATHCRTWLLSDPKNPVFQSICNHLHLFKCEKCQILINLIDKIRQIINSSTTTEELKEENNKDLDDAVNKIENWGAHIVRTINQDSWRLERIGSLLPGQGIVIMDWAMKYLPQRFREKQTDWFGQRGKHWHVTVLIFVDTDGNICHRTYTHVLESVKQDWFSVISLLEHTLNTVRQQLPDIYEISIRSDNAGCYHCGHLWLALPGVGSRTGINIKEYSYSEPQAGKSYCDSKIAHMRTKMKTYVASGKDIVTAKDMKVAIDDGSGVVGCQVAHVTVDVSKQTLKSHKWKGVNAYTDIKYEENGIRVFRAHGIGTGLLFTHADINKMASSLQDDTKLLVHEDFSLPTKTEGKIKMQSIAEQDPVEPYQGPAVDQNVETIENTTDDVSIPDPKIFSCPETGCVKIYRTFSGLEAHILFGKHLLRLERKSTYDEIRQQWASVCNEVCVSLKKPVCQGANEVEASASSTNMGYALKKDKKTTRFQQHVKDYLIRIYEEGELTGKKANPQDVAKEMRTLKNDEGVRLFKLSECLQSTQIASFFSRLAAKEVVSPDKNNQINDEDLIAVSALLDEASFLEKINTRL